jgi:lysophospholipase L1-like esterase
LNTPETYIFISVGGNNILNIRGQMNSSDIRKLFNDYMEFLKALKVKLNNAHINILNLYIPANASYKSYKSSIDEWNKLIKENSNRTTENYNVIHLDTLLTSPDDFVYEIEPSEEGCKKGCSTQDCCKTRCK